MSFMERMERSANRFYDSIRSSKARDNEATASGFGHLSGHKYALLVTYKKSGEAVPTPVWFGVDDAGRFYCRTGKQVAKVRRIRRTPRVKVAPCTLRGVPKGPYAEGTARVLESAEEEHAEHAIEANYGLVRKVYESSAGSVEASYIEVTPA